MMTEKEPKKIKIVGSMIIHENIKVTYIWKIKKM